MSAIATRFRTQYNHYITIFGADFTRTRATRTQDPLGYTTTEASATATIRGDFQLITDDTLIQSIGEAQIGDAMFYGRQTDDLAEGDRIVFLGDTWEFMKRAEPDHIEADQVSNTWLCRRIDG